MIWEKWIIQNMDDEHFNKMSAWLDQQKTRLFNRILQAIWKVLIVLQCRLKARNLARYHTMNEHMKARKREVLVSSLHNHVLVD